MGAVPYIATNSRMGNFFKKIFGPHSGGSPDNTRLLSLLGEYWNKQNDKSYEQVVLEVMRGNCFLLLPTRGRHEMQASGWHRTTTDQKINLASLFIVDNRKILGGFTDEKALLIWAKKAFPYVSMRGQSVLELCVANECSQLVINPGSENPFILQRQISPVGEYEVAKGAAMQIGVPAKPLSRKVTEQLLEYFKGMLEIEEVYQYGQIANGEFSVVLGFKLAKRDQKIEAAIVGEVRAALGREAPADPLDIHFFEPAGNYAMVKAVEGALLYKRGGPGGKLFD
jgi:SseB protein N-terminal domain